MPPKVESTKGRRATIPQGFDLTELHEAAPAAPKKEVGEEIKGAFQKFDLDGNGEIDKGELLLILQALDPVVWTPEHVDKLWKVIDANDDGVLSLEEFADWLTKPRRPINFDKDHTMSAEDLMSISLNFEALAATVQIEGGHGEVKEVLSDKELADTWARTSTCHVYGGMADRQRLGDERPRKFVGATTLPGDKPPVVACQKGSKGAGDPTPNQDNFSITYFKNGYTMICCFDGHGQDGHQVSTRTVQTAPYFLINSSYFPDKMEEALKESFNFAHSECILSALEGKWDAEASGSTAVAAVWKGNTVWMANAGDSRCVIGSRISKDKIIAQTEDHKPEMEKEKARIEAMGGEVKSRTYPDGWVNHRIFVKGQRYPGLCMSRTLGDNCAKACGVVSEPEVFKVEVDPKEKPFLFLASDGVWEFLNSGQVVRALVKDMERNGDEKAVARVQQESRRRWAKEEPDYCDDITSVLVSLE